ncbi:MAG TPA: glycoside hydrolase family 9 protein [Cyclobacteriaceae bacterium]|nr:glycoside hydrolase family 9 protein [Cyclobacteriaceae bacterium]
MKRYFFTTIVIASGILLLAGFYLKRSSEDEGIYFRINQAGYLPGDTKIAVAFSNSPIPQKFQVVPAGTKKAAYIGKAVKSSLPGWAPFGYYYILDFSILKKEGNYQILSGKDAISRSFPIGPDVYDEYADGLLEFMRQQRCGYNPFFNEVCHQHDGKVMYGPVPDSTYVDVTGGWHDAGDQLKYLITGSFASAIMMKAYEAAPEIFNDRFNELGQNSANAIPDVLDEAKWGLDWIHKLHPRPDWLIHQVGDDRDHKGWKLPYKEISDYGWGEGGYRVAYFANGQPQGLGKFKSIVTGIANVAGRSSAAMAIGYRIWNNLKDNLYADQCLKAAIELYEMGKAKEGYQQGNSYGAPYRYNEETWADDMEWAAAELYAATSDKKYLTDAIRYAGMAGTVTSWMELDSVAHYQYYPFINMGHYALYPHVDESMKGKLAGYYRSGIEKCLERGRKNIYSEGAPFIWCSNNLVTSLATQIILYEQMTGDMQYHDFMLAQRDWLLGKNPWGTSMFMNIPQDGEYPQDVHTSTWAMTRKEVPGGLVDGPVYGTIYRLLIGLELSEPDEFEAFQNSYVVYHDDIGDYSTNEPTMDGTAGAVLMMALISGDKP